MTYMYTTFILQNFVEGFILYKKIYIVSAHFLGVTEHEDIPMRKSEILRNLSILVYNLIKICL